MRQLLFLCLLLLPTTANAWDNYSLSCDLEVEERHGSLLGSHDLLIGGADVCFNQSPFPYAVRFEFHFMGDNGTYHTFYVSKIAVTGGASAETTSKAGGDYPYCDIDWDQDYTLEVVVDYQQNIYGPWKQLNLCPVSDYNDCGCPEEHEEDEE